jgi:hypothetical protein
MDGLAQDNINWRALVLVVLRFGFCYLSAQYMVHVSTDSIIRVMNVICSDLCTESSCAFN